VASLEETVQPKTKINNDYKGSRRRGTMACRSRKMRTCTSRMHLWTCSDIKPATEEDEADKAMT